MAPQRVRKWEMLVAVQAVLEGKDLQKVTARQVQEQAGEILGKDANLPSLRRLLHDCIKLFLLANGHGPPTANRVEQSAARAALHAAQRARRASLPVLFASGHDSRTSRPTAPLAPLPRQLENGHAGGHSSHPTATLASAPQPSHYRHDSRASRPPMPLAPVPRQLENGHAGGLSSHPTATLASLRHAGIQAPRWHQSATLASAPLPSLNGHDSRASRPSAHPASARQVLENGCNSLTPMADPTALPDSLPALLGNGHHDTEASKRTRDSHGPRSSSEMERSEGHYLQADPLSAVVGRSGGGGDGGGGIGGGSGDGRGGGSDGGSGGDGDGSGGGRDRLAAGVDGQGQDEESPQKGEKRRIHRKFMSEEWLCDSGEESDFEAAARQEERKKKKKKRRKFMSMESQGPSLEDVSKDNPHG